jgi:hypothetical protein
MENKEMSFQMFASKTTAILLFVFCGNVLASTFFYDNCAYLILSSEEERNALELDYYYKNLRIYKRKGFVANCDDSLSFDFVEVDPRPCYGIPDAYTGPVYHQGHALKKETLEIYTDNNGTKTITENIDCGIFSRRFKIEHDFSDNLIHSLLEMRNGSNDHSSRFESWNKDKLMRIRYNDVNRSIVERSPCYLKVLGPKSEEVIIRIDPEKEPPALVQKVVIDSGEVYEAIKYHWYPHCKKYHESKTLDTSLNSQKELDTSMKDSSSPYKYYAIISICIIAASIVAIRRKWRTKK